MRTKKPILLAAGALFLGACALAQNSNSLVNQKSVAHKPATHKRVATTGIPALGRPKLLLDSNGKALRWTVQPTELVREAAEAGNGAAMDNLGDRQGANFDWYLRSAQAGYLPGMMDVATAYEKGPKADPVQAKIWENKVAAALSRAWSQLDGHVDTQIAIHYSEGTAGLPKAPAEGLKWVRHAAGYNDPEALIMLAQLTSFGLSTPPSSAGQAATVLIPPASDYHQWSAYVEQAADNGDPEAELFLGQALTQQRNLNPQVPANPGLGMSWITKSAQQSYFPAFAALADRLIADSDPAQKKQGIAWLMSGIAAGDPDSLARLGKFYVEGDAPYKNPALGTKMLEAAAAHDSFQADQTLATIYGNGIGVPQSNAMAEQWLRKTLIHFPEGQQDLQLATFYAGNYYEDGRAMIAKPDGKLALEFYVKAASDPSTAQTAYVAIAAIFANGTGGVHQDYGQALSWYKKACTAGDSSVSFQIANLYENGQGMPRDYAAAMQWYEKVYDNPDNGYRQADAAIALGNMYAFGEGVSPDPHKAFEWYQKAEALNVYNQWDTASSEAEYLIGMLYREGYGFPKDAAKAVSWYQKASASTHPFVSNDSLIALGDMYGTGEGIGQDLNQQVQLYWRVGSVGNLRGLEKLAHVYMSRSDWNHAQQDNNYDGRVQQGAQAVRDKKYPDAIKVAVGLLGDFPMRWEGYALWGAIERAQNNSMEATAAYQHAIDLAPAEAKNQLTLALAQIADSDKYDKLLAAALTSWKSKEAPQALTATAGLISMDPKRWEGYYLSASIEEKFGHEAQAKAAYQQALNLAPVDRKYEIAAEMKRGQ